jgi:ABC-type sugar transport system ATPase subunit
MVTLSRGKVGGEKVSDRPFISMRGVTKRFPGVLALNKVDLDLRPGEVHALVGENGSGKSTLCKCLYGMVQPDEGDIHIDGVPEEIHTPQRALRLGIAAITQELTLAPTLSVTENILMGRLPRSKFGIDWKRAHSLARDALDQVGVEIDERLQVGSLSVALQQEVEIARAVSTRSRVLILDEATSSLSEAATERLMLKIAQLRSQGVSIVFVSHRLKEIFMCCQRATVLRDGALVDVVDVSKTTEGELVSKMVGRTMEDLYGKRPARIGNTILDVKNLSTLDLRVRNVSFKLRKGEILGISALVGSGKVHLGKAVFGAIPATGEVRLNGKPLKLGVPSNGMNAGIAFVPDDRKGSALLLTRSVRHNMSLPWMKSEVFSRLGIVRMRAERALANDCIARFMVRTPSLNFPVVNLSGGNQQKVILARCFAMKPQVVVLSEPTRGIDVGAKSEVYKFIQDLAATGAGVIMISSELPELLGLTDRILVMYQGEICGEFDPRNSGEEDIAHAACTGKKRTTGVEA